MDASAEIKGCHLQASQEQHDAFCHAAPVKRKRLLLLPALPLAQRPCGAQQSATQAFAPTRGCASAHAEQAQPEVVASADRDAAQDAAGAPVGKQPPRQLKSPMLLKSPVSAFRIRCQWPFAQ